MLVPLDKLQSFTAESRFHSYLKKNSQSLPAMLNCVQIKTDENCRNTHQERRYEDPIFRKGRPQDRK